MLLIIRGPQGSGKSRIAKQIASYSEGAILYDEIPIDEPVFFSNNVSKRLVIITTNLMQTAKYPKWLFDFEYSTLECHPMPF